MQAAMAFALLKRRTQSELYWDIFAALKPGMDADAVTALRVGGANAASTAENSVAKLFNEKSISSMSVEERDSIYMKALSAVGMAMTSEQLRQLRESDIARKEEKQEAQKQRHRRKGNIIWE